MFLTFNKIQTNDSDPSGFWQLYYIHSYYVEVEISLAEEVGKETGYRPPFVHWFTHLLFRMKGMDNSYVISLATTFFIIGPHN
jgi:hypothetical protein